MDPVIANAVESFLNFSPNTEDPPKTLEVLGAMSLSFVLNMLIGALYKHTYKGTRYSQDYVHTIVIIGKCFLIFTLATHLHFLSHLINGVVVPIMITLIINRKELDLIINCKK